MKKIFTATILALLSLNTAWSQFTVSGTITTEEGEGVQGVLVGDYVGGNFSITDGDGHYQIEFPAGSDVNIVPHSDNDPLNGVSTFDAVLIMQHVYGVLPLGSPYKMIAADANKSNSITTLDSLVLMELITGVTTTFPNNTSWRFIDKDYVFPNPLNPFQSLFPEAITINNIAGNITGVDFIAIKVGDVNSSAFPILTPDTTLLSTLSGHITYDLDENCTVSPGDTPLKGWKVKATGGNGTYYGISQASGYYAIHLPPGTYQVEIVQPNGLWAACTAVVPNVSVASQGSVAVDFMEQAVTDCALLSVDLSTWILRRCFPGTYYVSYCNDGTVAAEDAYVEVTLDSFLENVTSSIPWSSVSNHTYTFDLGQVAAGDCGNFILSFVTGCEAVLGQTHCSSAHIYPDDPCIPASALWNGADLEVTGECTGSDVVFTITNVGDDMTEPVPYVVIEDIMIQMQGSDLQLAHGQSTTIGVPANGSTYRLQATEAEFHPFETFASATVEGCGTNGNGTFSLGFVNQFPLPDETPYEDIDCQENIGSFDPNDKTGYPTGYDASHFIEKGQDISYLIRFQNTGTDTAFTVLVVDTLPAEVDPTTLRFNGSSHPMEFDLEGQGVARFRFPNIMLPDSNVNEAASHGFVKFTISQRPDLAIGTSIENEAGIYFDFNDPVITNRTLHTIGEDLVLSVTEQKVFVPGVEVAVFPNPFASTATFQIKGWEAQAGTLTIYDRQGQRMGTAYFTGHQLVFDGSALPSGLYFFRIEDGGRLVSSGKMVVR